MSALKAISKGKIRSKNGSSLGKKSPLNLDKDTKNSHLFLNKKSKPLKDTKNSHKKLKNSKGLALNSKDILKPLKIKNEHLSLLKKSKNLLAFSYGSDSTALFYTLVAHKINFDLVLINYKKRKQSDKEERAAKKLARDFNKQIFVKIASNFKGNFQQKARDFRYEFFNELCLNYKYETVLLAQQMNDRFEWFLRQLARGAGVVELLGMKESEKRANFTLLRPFLNTPKAEILGFLEKEKIQFFNDESNENEKYERNFIRKHFATPFMSEFSAGVAKSFAYLEKDAKNLCDDEIAEFKGILVCECLESAITRAVKKMGVVMSVGQRKELTKNKEFNDIVVSGRVAIAFMCGKCLVFKYSKAQSNSHKIPKSQRENYRKAKIPKLLRPYLYENGVETKDLLEFLGV